MLNLDRSNLRILEILAQNCRISHMTIARALKVSKDTVAYRIAKMEEAGIISSYVLFCDARRLGFTRYHLLLQFDSLALLSKEKINAITRHPFVMWVNSFVGKYDLQVIVDAENLFHLDQIKSQLFEFCDFKIKNFIVLSHLYDLEFTQLNPVLNLGTVFEREDPHGFGRNITRKNFPVSANFVSYAVDRLDCKILNGLALSPRIGITELAAQVKAERITVRKRILRMIKEGVILNFGAIPDLTMLGFVTYYMLIRLAQNIPASNLRKPFKSLKNIFYAGAMLGDYDMIAYLNARTPHELNESIASFRRDLGNSIMSFDLLVQDKVYHWKQYTEGLHQQLLSRQQKSLARQ